MIQKYDIQKLRELDILQVADLLGMGLRNKRALCIHHDDHHPSLAFNVKKNTCHCYSCGFSADTIALVRERLNLGFSEACRWLADHFDVYIGDEKYGNSARYADKCADKKVLTASDRRMAILLSDAVSTFLSAHLSAYRAEFPYFSSPIYTSKWSANQRHASLNPRFSRSLTSAMVSAENPQL